MQRREFINLSTLVAGGTVLGSSAFNILQGKQLGKEIIGHGDFKYRVVREWGNLNPSTTPVKNCHEMVSDKKGRLFMTTDEVKNNIIIYDKSGKKLNSWTLNLPGAHGLTYWQGDDEYLFITETTKGQGKVIKTTLDGKVLMEIEHPSKVGAYDNDMRFQPTETAIGPNGDIYISDGYGSQFILQYSSNGEFIRKFGGSGNGASQFKTAHGVQIDYRDKEPILMCTSRKHNSFKKFSLDGKYLGSIWLPGAFVCRAVFDDDMLYAGVCWSRLNYLEKTNNSGFVTILDKNDHVVSNPGGTEPTYVNGKLMVMVQDKPIFNHCHDVFIDEDKNLYICQWNANKSYPIKLERI